jgi:hypothetical protein
MTWPTNTTKIWEIFSTLKLGKMVQLYLGNEALYKFTGFGARTTLLCSTKQEATKFSKY